MKRRQVIKLIALSLVVPAAFLVSIRWRAKRLEGAHTEGAMALDAVVLKHVVPQPLHDNGIACLLAMGKQVPPNHALFRERGWDQVLRVFLDGRGGTWAELPAAVHETAERLRPWATSMRECASSARLQLVDGLRAEDPKDPGSPTDQTLAALDVFFRWQAAELQRLSEEQAPAEVRLERCSAALALAADATFLGGDRGADLGSSGALILLPRCGDALALVTPGLRRAVSAEWAKLPSRLVTPSHLVRWGHYGDRSWRFSRGFEGFNGPVDRLEREREWSGWDDEMATLETALDADPSRQKEATNAFDRARGYELPAAGSEAELGLWHLSELRRMLEVLAAVAAGDERARPGVTRAGGVLTMVVFGVNNLSFKLPN